MQSKRNEVTRLVYLARGHTTTTRCIRPLQTTSFVVYSVSCAEQDSYHRLQLWTSKTGHSASSSSPDPSSLPTPRISGQPPRLLKKRHFRVRRRAFIVNRSLPEITGSSRYRDLQYYTRRMSFVKAHYHPFLFALIMLSAMAELGLTSFLIGAGNENGTWPSERYHSM